jgi:hypothetical protein
MPLPLLAAGRWFDGGLIDPPRLMISLGPLAIYLLALGYINLSRRPWLTTGARDGLALGIGVAGLILIGPVELLSPEQAAVVFKGWVWALWLVFYGLVLSLIVLSLPPRLTIYNVTLDELHPVLLETAPRLDPAARWAGDTLLLPNLRVQLRLESFGVMRNVSLVSVGQRQSHEGWRRLEVALAEALSRSAVPANPPGVSLVFFGLLIVVVLTWKWLYDPQAVTRGFVEMLRL